MAKRKQKTIAKLADDNAVLLQKLVRLKAADEHGMCECASCGTRKHWKEMQGGHFIARGNNATKLMEENVNPQCQGCNAFGMKYGDAEKKYTLWMIDIHGRDFIEEMMATKGKVFRFIRGDLDAMKIELNQRIKELEQEIA